MNISVDIIIFAAIAAVLLWRLRSVLGERHEDEPKRNNRLIDQLRALQQDQEKRTPTEHGNMNTGHAALTSGNGSEHNEAHDGSRWANELPNYTLVGSATAHNRLAQFLTVDPSFRPDQFLASAQKAFTMIIEAYSTNARTTLEFLVAPALLQRFISQLDAREEKHETYHVQFYGIKKAVISEAELSGTIARVTVDFTAEQSITHKDASGHILNNNDGRRRETNDRWVFQKDLKDSSPSWLLDDALDPIDD